MTQTFETRRKTRGYLFIALAILLAIAALFSVAVGQYEISFRDLPALLSSGPVGHESMDGSVLWQIRLPRLILGLLVGSVLASVLLRHKSPSKCSAIAAYPPHDKTRLASR